MTKRAASDVAGVIEAEVQAIHRLLMSYPWAKRTAYAEFLAQTYFYVRRVTHVLAAAAARTPIDEPDLHEHFLKGISEEKSHAALLIDDLRDLDFAIDSFSEHPLTQAYYQTLFYAIDTYGPLSILGYFVVVEGISGERGQQLHQLVARSHGGRADSFMREHVVADAEHYPEALEMLKKLSESQLDTVERTAKLAGPLYRYMVSAIMNESAAR